MANIDIFSHLALRPVITIELRQMINFRSIHNASFHQ